MTSRSFPRLQSLFKGQKIINCSRLLKSGCNNIVVATILSNIFEPESARMQSAGVTMLNNIIYIFVLLTTTLDPIFSSFKIWSCTNQ